MTNSRWTKLTPVIFFAIFTFVSVTLVVLNPTTVGTTSDLYTIGFIYFLLWWFQMDRSERGIQLPLDTGCLMGWAWPVAYPFYLVKTRGWKSLARLAVLLGIYILIILVAFVFATIIKLILT